MKLAKRRYLLVKIDSAAPVSAGDAEALFRSAVLEAFGEKGIADSSLKLKAFNEPEQLALVRCSLAFQERAVAAFALKRLHDGHGIALRLQKIFGTLKKARPLFPGLSAAVRRRQPQKKPF
ncbi:MAG: Rpp14/Pop5 family protein [Candidatus Micrarchaeota archaeon]